MEEDKKVAATCKNSKEQINDHLFSLSLDDILNEHFYKDKVEDIPESFESIRKYLGSYIYPLLEEVRAELCSSLKSIATAPFAEVITVQESKPYGKCTFKARVGLFQNRLYNLGKDPYRTVHEDLFLVVDAKPETVINSKFLMKNWALASVQQIKYNGDSSSLNIKLQASKNIRPKDGKGGTLFVIFLMNLITHSRIWRSLHLHGNTNIIKQLLSSNSMGDEICGECSLISNTVIVEKLETRLSPLLNDPQKAAVLCCVCKTFCYHKSSVELIWGPPGTGKTKTVSILLWTVLELNYRVLACAPTNIAVTELASRVVKLLKESDEINDLFCSLGDVLLYGNKDRLNIGSELEEVHLDYRVDILSKCFGTQTGWKHCLSSMIKLLDDSIPQYQAFLESKLNEREGKGKKKKRDNEDKSFLGFMREQFKSNALKLKSCLQNMSTHIPKRFLLDQNVQNMEILFKLIDSLETLLFKDNVVSEDLMLLFSNPESVLLCPNSSLYTSDFPDLRRGCLSVMIILLVSLGQLKLPRTPSKSSLEEFCLQGASLILCTVSTSSKLHLIKMKPVDLVLIDEAAQLRECESAIPLRIPGVRHAILIGDELQLPAYVASEVSSGAGFGRSLFERLSLLGHSKHLLNIQYRMHPSVSCFPNSKFYNNQILDAPNVKSRSYKKRYLLGKMFGPYSFINVHGGKEERDDCGSCKNMVEVAAVIRIIQKLYKAWRSSLRRKLSIGVISPYAAQIVAIQDKLGWKYEKIANFSVKVKSVDGFQGSEEDVIIISTVRSNSKRNIGFLSNPQRINVALTRARHCLWILGDERTLENSNSDWKAVVQDAKVRQCFFHAEEDDNLANAIIDAKKELLELDDLLSKDSILFKKARWKVLFSDSFRASFQQMKSIYRKKSIIILLLRLSGGWRPENDKISFPENFRFLKHVKVERLHIIYSIDIERDSEYFQVLKIWDIMDDVKVLAKPISDLYGLYTDDFLNHCKAKCLEGDLEVPITWSSSYDIVRYKDDKKTDEIESISSSESTENPNMMEILLGMKFHVLSYQKVKQLLDGCGGRELDLPYQASDQQLEIILYPTSLFLIGRPGTEKTASLATKLFERERQYHQPKAGIDEVTSNKIQGTVLRQLFVTVTPKQCVAVKQHFSYLKRITCGGHVSGNNTFDQFDMHDVIDDPAHLMDIPNSFVDIPSDFYPIFITFRKFLMMLDGSVGSSYFVKIHKLWQLSHGKSRQSMSTVLESFIRAKEVNCERFNSSYWPYFNSRLTKNLDASVVFTEIAYQIKGGLQAGETHDGKISRHDYILLSKSQYSILCKKKREKIYDIFLDYEKRKMEKGEYDLADLVIDLHHRLRENKYIGEKMDFVYVDEVQGLTMRQIALFKDLCDNVDSGFVFSSNTAQTIARGIDYRIRDVRLMVYKEFISNRRCDSHEKVSDIFHMSQNFNTHSHILRLGQSVIDLLFRFFPLSVDILCPEISVVNGEIPVFLEYEKSENLFTTVFEMKENVGMSTFGFGAEQIILVRDDCERKKVTDLVGNRALVLTIMECQCLEFQDVLLYNFFSSSLLESHWQVTYEYMQEQDMLESAPSRSFPSFTQEKYKDLCWELKLLYVATTRSRNRLWIYEENQRLSHPIFDYWKKLRLIQVRRLDYLFVQEIQVTNTKEEWSSKGLELFYEGIYDMASKCFHRAEDMEREKWARATSLRSSTSNPERAPNPLCKAAEIFSTLGRADIAAKCFIQSKEYEKAAKLYLTECGEQMLEEAGDCYTLAECYDFAAELYSRGIYWSKFLYVCTIAKFFDMELEFIQSLKQCDDSMIQRSTDIEEIKQVYLENGALHYHLLQDNKTMMKFVGAFNSMDLRHAFLKNLDCLDDLLLLEKESGNFVEAAAIAMKRGDLLLEVDLLEKAGLFKNASLLVLFYVLFNSLWAAEEKNGWPLKQFEQKEKLLTRAKLLAKNESESFYEYVCLEANIVSNRAMTLLEMKQHWSASKRQGNLRCGILSARQILDAHLSSSASEFIWEDELTADLLPNTELEISLNQVSLKALVYFWNLWTEKIENVLKCLDFPDTKEFGDCMSYEDFCLNYLGARKQSNSEKTVYILLDHEVYWAKKVHDRFPQENGSMDAQLFIDAAKSFWRSELLSVGLKVFEKINDLDVFCISNTSSVVSQCDTSRHLFVVAKFLTDALYHKLYIDRNTLRQIFDVGLNSILYLRGNHLAQAVFSVNTSQDMHSFLVKCALHYHELKDNCTMLKFVRAFDSIELKCSFLSSLGCFNKLLLLEVEVGYFSEAVAIVRFKGDLLLMIDLLEKNGSHRDASLLIMFYVLATSLWGSESKGWPLKEFKNKQKLLKRAKSIAEKESNIFHEMVSTEVDILSNKASSLFEMVHYLTASKKHKSLRGIVLSARKILDALFRYKASSYEWDNELVIDPRKYSEETISQNRVSVQSLVYFWNFWKDSLVNIVDYLSSVESPEPSEYESSEGFCLSYLGVWRQTNDQSSVYCLLNSDADWARKFEDGSLGKTGGQVSMTASQFVPAASTYWRSEVLNVGVKVLEKLKDLFIFSTANPVSELSQNITGIHFIEVINSLSETKFFKSASDSELKCLFEVKSQFFKSCKKHLREDVSLASPSDELNGIKLALLKRCALHYCNLQDNSNMMKFVRQFHSMDSKRLFLKSFGCYDELLSMEEESGNFLEAASIARIKGDLFLEVDLLEKAGLLKEAAKIILLYVLANSLWGSKSKGWPLKMFKQREELLSKAKSFAKQHSDDIFYETVCTEASILLDSDISLSEMNSLLSTSHKNRDITGGILSARKILDAHLCSSTSVYGWEDELVTDPMNHSEDKLSQGQVSVQTLFHLWNVWKDHILSVIQSLKCLDAHNYEDFILYEEFCLNYLGIRKQSDNQNTYHLLISDADWVGPIRPASLQGNAMLNAQFFSMAAMNYWSTELLSVGMKVLEKLSALHMFSVKNSFSVYHQSLNVITIFEVSRFFSGYNFSEHPTDEQRLRGYMESSVQYFFNNVFGLSWIKSITENMTALRGAMLSRGIHEEIITKIIELENELPIGKIGRIMMVVLGSGKLSTSLYEKITKKLNTNLPWKAVVDELKRCMTPSKIPEDSGVLVFHLHKALKDSYQAMCRKAPDYISPNCFLYILERQLVLISILQGRFYTTRSSFIEWLISSVGSTSVPKKSMVDFKPSVPDLYAFIRGLIHKLVINNCDAREWIKRFNINSKEYYPLFLLRLIIMMCLLCVNSGKYYDVLHEILGRHDVGSQLPRDFYAIIKNGRKHKKNRFVHFLGEALWKIKNPLVEVSPEACPEKALSNPNVIMISTKNVRNDKEMRRVLFLENGKDYECRDGHLHKAEQNGNVKRSESDASEIKVPVEKTIHNTEASSETWAFQNSSFCRKSGKSLEVEGVVDKLKKLSIALDMSDPMFADKISTIKELSEMMMQNDFASGSRVETGDGKCNLKEKVPIEKGTKRGSEQKRVLVWEPKTSNDNNPASMQHKVMPVNEKCHIKELSEMMMQKDLASGSQVETGDRKCNLKEKAPNGEGTKGGSEQKRVLVWDTKTSALNDNKPASMRHDVMPVNEKCHHTVIRGSQVKKDENRELKENEMGDEQKRLVVWEPKLTAINNKPTLMQNDIMALNKTCQTVISVDQKSGKVKEKIAIEQKGKKIGHDLQKRKMIWEPKLEGVNNDVLAGWSENDRKEKNGNDNSKVEEKTRIEKGNKNMNMGAGQEQVKVWEAKRSPMKNEGSASMQNETCGHLNLESRWEK